MSDMPYGEGYYMPCGFFTRDEISAVAHMDNHPACNVPEHADESESVADVARKTRPRLLDLFCCAGGAGTGRAAQDEVRARAFARIREIDDESCADKHYENCCDGHCNLQELPC